MTNTPTTSPAVAIRTGDASIPVLIGQLPTRDQSYAMGIIRVADLVTRTRIARRQTFEQSGYQRDASPSRVNALSTSLRSKSVDLPTAVLLNMRDFDRDRHLAVGAGENQLLILGVDDVLFIVDGQHRVEALNKLYREDAEIWADYTLPFGCLLGAPELLEMEEFYVVNSNAKSVSTSLAFDLLKQRADMFPAVMEQLTEQGKGWQPVAETLVEALSSSPLWLGRIRFPLQPKKDTIVSNNGLATSLKPLLNSPFFGGLTTENQVKILAVYWEAVRRVLPDAFSDATAYSLQKSLGVVPLHQFLVSVLEVVRSRNWPVTEPDSFREVIQVPLDELSGDLADGTTARGVDFWRSGPEGAAGSFSSHAGQRVLLARLKQRLPAITID